MADDSIKWPGLSGNEYTYYIYDMPGSFKAQPGNYIFCKIVNNEWVPIYIGETSDLSDRFENHHASSCIINSSVTHIHAHLTKGGKQVRLDEETDLRQNFDTPCNKQ